VLACCDAEIHEWDRWEVERQWLPSILRCFIVGENPGDRTSEYFYNPPASYALDRVVVRRALLDGLYRRGLIVEPTLEGFREAGFLFDHAIRCQLSSEAVKSERQKATRYASPCVGNADHLRPWLAKAHVVWVMGHLASNAVAKICPTEFPEQKRKISRRPFPCEVARNSKFFLSEYLSWRTKDSASTFAEAFKRFARERDIF